MWLPNKAVELRDSAVAEPNGPLGKVRAVQARLRMLFEKLDLPKRLKSASRNMKVINRKAGGAQGGTTNLAMGWHRRTECS